MQIRSALGDEVKSPTYIETIRKRGYRAIRTELAKNTTMHSVARPEAELIEQLYSAIAVLPLENRTGDSELDSLCEDIAEDLTDSLARLGMVASGFRLIGRHETLALRDKSVGEIAKTLNVGGVLRGSVRNLGTQARLSMELANAIGEQVWRDTFDAPFEELSANYGRLVDKVIPGFLEGVDRYLGDRASKLPVESLGPMGLLAKAGAVRGALRSDTHSDCLRWIEQAIELSHHQLALKGILAERIALGIVNGLSTDGKSDAKRALALGEEAARTENGIALMHASLAFGALGEHQRGLALARRCHEMAPRYMPFVWRLAGALLYSGEPQEALQLYLVASAQKRPVQASRFSTEISKCHLMMGNLADAMKYAQNAVDWGMWTFESYVALANVLACVDRIEESMAAIEKARQLEPRLRIKKLIRANRRLFATEEAQVAMTRGFVKLVELGYE